MIKADLLISQPSFNRLLSQSLAVALLSTLGLFAGVTADWSGGSLSFQFGSAASAQANDEVQRFANAAYEIETRRQAVADQVKKITGGNVPDIACNQPERLDAYPGNIRSIFVDFCNFSRQTIEKYGLTVARFNQIMVERQSNSELQRRIDSELLRLQKASNL